MNWYAFLATFCIWTLVLKLVAWKSVSQQLRMRSLKQNVFFEHYWRNAANVLSVEVPLAFNWPMCTPPFLVWLFL